jgi:hypothetical protein
MGQDLLDRRENLLEMSVALQASFLIALHVLGKWTSPLGTARSRGHRAVGSWIEGI